MADYNVFASAGPDPDDRGYVPNQATGIHDRLLQSPVTPYDGLIFPATPHNVGQLSIDAEPALSHDYAAAEDGAPQQFWFELCHFTPDIIELGNILTTTLTTIEIYNAHRDDDKELSSATANAGPGVSFIGLPGLPAVLPEQSGLVFQVQVTTVGPPNIDGTLDFVTTCGTFAIALTGDRVVMFPYQPETGIDETLQFLTDISKATDGTEQRISNRKNPRQRFTMNMRVEEGKELRDMQALLQGWHPGVFGVPIWWESRELGADAATDATVITMDTRYADFRVGSLAILWSGPETFDALQIQSLTDTTMTFTSGLTQDFSAADTVVMPLRTGYLSSQISANRYIKNLMDVQLQVRVIDNDVEDIGDVTAFSSHNSKVLLDDPNMIDGTTVADGLTRDMIIIDSPASNEIQFSLNLTSKTVTSKGFFADSMQEVWQVRQLVHALHGSQIAFYLPTFYNDLVVTEDLQSASSLMDIESIKYVDFIQAKEPFKSIWIELNDGTILTREVTAYDKISDTVERLTVGTPWPSLIAKEDITRISFCRLVRIAGDEVKFNHYDRPGAARIKTSIIGVGSP